MSASAVLALIAFAFDEIRGIVTNPVTSAAADVANAISNIFAAVDNATAGHVTPEDAKTQIEALAASLRVNDAAADAALAAKFPQEVP